MQYRSGELSVYRTCHERQTGTSWQDTFSFLCTITGLDTFLLYDSAYDRTEKKKKKKNGTGRKKTQKSKVSPEQSEKTKLNLKESVRPLNATQNTKPVTTVDLV